MGAAASLGLKPLPLLIEWPYHSAKYASGEVNGDLQSTDAVFEKELYLNSPNATHLQPAPQTNTISKELLQPSSVEVITSNQSNRDPSVQIEDLQPDSPSLQEEATLPFPKVGVSLRVFFDFIDRCGGLPKVQGLTTTDVNEQFQKPLTAETNTSYCEYLIKEGTLLAEDVRRANVFVSHAWKYLFLDVVFALETHFKGKEDETVLWFDMFSNNQHAAPDLDFHWWSTTFKSAIDEFGYTVMVLAPWEDPVPFTRAWCLFELYCTVETKSKFDVVMGKEDRAKFIRAVDADPSVYFTMLSTIDVLKSQSWNPLDRDRIFAAVKESVGFRQLNTTVKKKMRDWCIETVEEAASVGVSIFRSRNISNKGDGDDVDDTSSSQQEVISALFAAGSVRNDQGDYQLALAHFQKVKDLLASSVATPTADPMLLAKCYNCMGNVYKNLGGITGYQNAMSFYEESKQLRVTTLGEQHLDVAECLNNMGIVLTRQLNYTRALDCFQNAKTIREEALGSNHPDVATVHNNIGVMYESQQDYPLARDEFDQALRIRIRILGEKHPNVASTYNNLAIIHDKMGDHAKSLKAHNKALKIRKELLGDRHPDVATCCNNIGNLHLTTGKFDKALKHYQLALDIRKESLGEKHTAVASCYNNMGNVYKNQQDYPKALEYYELALHICRDTLDPSHQALAGCLKNVEDLRSLMQESTVVS